MPPSAPSEFRSEKAFLHPPRLTRARLNAIPVGVNRPRFDSAALTAGIVHLGCGSFHRAHQAFLTQQAIEAEYSLGCDASAQTLPPWGIVAVSLVTPHTTSALSLQDGLYTVIERGAENTRFTVVGSFCSLIFGPDKPVPLQQAMANPAVRIVTLTVTAAGYFADQVTGRIDATHPSIQRDLINCYPRTAIGVLVAGLAVRRGKGIRPPVILCCDNVPSNGPLVRQMCIDFAALSDEPLAEWIACNVQFPSTMVDRIVPATTDDDRDLARDALQLIDAVPVSAEPYSQWVIEHFDGARPRWDLVGAQYVADVAPWEASKLRLLNGGHLAIAFLGLLAGCETVADAMAVPGMSAYALRFMLDEQKPTLPPSNHDISAYAEQLLARWRSRSVVHRLDRVARDASSKLAPRLLASLRDNLQASRPAPCTILAVAAWMRCTAGTDDAGKAIVVLDKLHGAPDGAADAAPGSPANLVDALLGLVDIFGEDLPRDPRLRLNLIQAVSLLEQRGVRGAVAACIAGSMFDTACKGQDER